MQVVSVIAASHSSPQEWKVPACQPGQTHFQLKVISNERREGKLLLEALTPSARELLTKEPELAPL